MINIYKPLIFLILLVQATASFAQDSTVVSFRKVGLSCLVMAKVNEFPVEFVFDTGAELISIPQKLANLLEAKGAIHPFDYTGEKISIVTASGETVKGRSIIFSRIEFGEFHFLDVEGVVMPSDSAAVLLGQTVFTQLSSYTIDNNSRKITLIRKEAQPSLPLNFSCDSILLDSFADNSLDLKEYQSLGITDVNERWEEIDYENALNILEKLNAICPLRLPRIGSEKSAALFTKLLKSPELMGALQNFTTSKGSQVELNNMVIHNMGRLFRLYSSKNVQYWPERYALYEQEIYEMEELAALIKRVKSDTKILPPPTLELLKDAMEANMNNVLDLFLWDNWFLGEANTEAMAKKVAVILPSYLKYVGRSKFKANIKEQVWLLSEMAPNEQVRKEMSIAFDELKPQNEEKSVGKERENLLELCLKEEQFVFACLSNDGIFIRNDKKDLLEFRLVKFEPKIKLVLSFEKGQHKSLRGKKGSIESKVYEMDFASIYDYFEKIDLIIKELVGAN